MGNNQLGSHTGIEKISQTERFQDIHKKMHNLLYALDIGKEYSIDNNTFVYVMKKNNNMLSANFIEGSHRIVINSFDGKLYGIEREEDDHGFKIGNNGLTEKVTGVMVTYDKYRRGNVIQNSNAIDKKTLSDKIDWLEKIYSSLKGLGNIHQINYQTNNDVVENLSQENN